MPGEGAAAVPRHAAVGIDDDLAPGQAAVGDRATGFESSGRVDERLGIGGDPVAGHDGFDDLLHDRFVQRGVVHRRRVMCRDDDGVDGNGDAIGVVLERELTLGVGAEKVDSRAPYLGVTAHEPMRVGDGGGHQHVGLRGRVTEHQALVPGALLVIRRLVDPLGDLGGLLPKYVHHPRRSQVVAADRIPVSDVVDDSPCQRIDIHVRAGPVLAGDHDEVVL